MDFVEPAKAEAIIGDLRYRTEGATLLAVLESAPSQSHSHWYLFRTPKGNYFYTARSPLTKWRIEREFHFKVQSRSSGPEVREGKRGSSHCVGAGVPARHRGRLNGDYPSTHLSGTA